MIYIRGSRPLVNPVAVYGYFDVIQVWLQKPATNAELDEIVRHCGSVTHRNKRMRADGNFLQYLKLRQPRHKAVEWLAGREDAFINGGEVALDLVFSHWLHRDNACDFVDRHLIRRWHGRKQSIRFAGEMNPTRYDAGRSARNRIARYCRDHCRATGELDVPTLHVEWRLSGVRAMRAAGISKPADLLTFDFREFWRRHLLLRALRDKERLGRAIRNSRRKPGARDRKPLFRKGRNQDARLGHIYLDCYASIQEIIDATRGARLGSALEIIDNTPFLPPAGECPL